ncbi:MAG: M14 family zinc carboxypeptidase [Aureliella sp.]
MLLLLPTSLHAEDPCDVLPADERAVDILSPGDFFGFAVGSRHLRHDQVIAYWRYLASSSDRVELIEYAQSHGKRPLQVLAISSPANISDLENIQKRRTRLTSGRFRGHIQDEKVVMYLGYCVHGDEASAINASPLVAYHLASSLSPSVASWLEQGIYLVDPALNPDGADRFANWSNENRGRFPSASSLDREHVQPWPGGRTNYYWFDLNRDWLPTVHPESQGRIKLFHQWKPNVVLDFHEMSGSSSFFFQPGIPARNNPLSPGRNLELTREFAKEHVRRMDAAGEAFFTEERFDDFYPGKGSTYPDLHGAIGILFEQGSTRGLKLTNDRTDRHFRDTVANQVRMSLSSLDSANRLKDELLEFQTDFYAEALGAGESAYVTAYLLHGTPSRILAAAQILRRHRIQVAQSDSPVHVDGQVLDPEQVLIIPTAQPEYTFVQSLMEPLQDFRENIFYDVSTWHLPSALDLGMIRFQSTLPESWMKPFVAGQSSQAATEARSDSLDAAALAGIAFEPTELGAPAMVVALQQIGAKIRVANAPFVAVTPSATKTLPLGTFVLVKQANVANWSRIVQRAKQLGQANQIEVVAIQSGGTPVGPDLGSDTTSALVKSEPLLVVGEGTSAYTAGAIWHFLDHRMRQPATLINAERLQSTPLDSFSSVILPAGSYGGWGAAEAEELRRYCNAGGTVIGVASAIRWLQRYELVPESSSTDTNHADHKTETSTSEAPRFGDARTQRALESIAGVFLKTKIDPTHPLAYGFADESVPTFRDHTLVFRTPKNPYQTVASYEGLIAGYASQRNRNRLEHSAAVFVQPVGQGNIICIADNPVFRGYVRSSERFLTNAILLGPSISVPSAPSDESSASDGHGHHHD